MSAFAGNTTLSLSAIATQQVLHSKKVAWLSHSWGYNKSFMYWNPILAGYGSAFKNSVVFAERGMRQDQKYGIALNQTLKVYNVEVRKPQRDADYGLVLDLPGPGLALQLIKESPDLLILNDFSRVTLLGAIAARLLPRCRVMLLVESDPKYRGLRHDLAGVPAQVRGYGGFERRIRSWIARNADVVLTNNISGEGYVSGTLGVEASQIITRPYLTSQPNEATVGDCRPIERGKSEKLVFLFLNSINPRKGVECMIRAVAVMDTHKREKMLLNIVGDGPQRPALEGLVAQLGLQDTIKFVGKVAYSEIARYYQSADVFVAPTLLDYRSLTGFEALSFGLPILMSCHDGAVYEVVDEGRNGQIVDPRDAGAFASKFSWFIDERERLGDMCIASAAINKRYTVSSVVDNLVYASERALTRR